MGTRSRESPLLGLKSTLLSVSGVIFVTDAIYCALVNPLDDRCKRQSDGECVLCFYLINIDGSRIIMLKQIPPCADVSLKSVDRSVRRVALS